MLEYRKLEYRKGHCQHRLLVVRLLVVLLVVRLLERRTDRYRWVLGFRVLDCQIGRLLDQTLDWLERWAHRTDHLPLALWAFRAAYLDSRTGRQLLLSAQAVQVHQKDRCPQVLRLLE